MSTPPLPPEVEAARRAGVRRAYGILARLALVALPLWAIFVFVTLVRLFSRL